MGIAVSSPLVFSISSRTCTRTTCPVLLCISSVPGPRQRGQDYGLLPSPPLQQRVHLLEARLHGLPPLLLRWLVYVKPVPAGLISMYPALYALSMGCALIPNLRAMPGTR